MWSKGFQQKLSGFGMKYSNKLKKILKHQILEKRYNKRIEKNINKRNKMSSCQHTQHNTRKIGLCPIKILKCKSIIEKHRKDMDMAFED